MIFYVIAASPMDVITQIQNNSLWFHLDLCKLKLEEFSKNSKIYQVRVMEESDATGKAN